MSEQSSRNGQTVYRFRLQGHLSHQWDEWFDGLTIMLHENGDTILIGPVADQAALFGYLKKIRDLGMPLISLFSCCCSELCVIPKSSVMSPSVKEN